MTDRLRHRGPDDDGLLALPGMVLSHTGDRVAMANGVEARCPFLDDDVLARCSRLHPRWKLRGLFGDQHLLRRVALKRLPPRIERPPVARAVAMGRLGGP
jgi:asparagine synthetase B (glutamine-hydrolysing)